MLNWATVVVAEEGVETGVVQVAEAPAGASFATEDEATDEILDEQDTQTGQTRKSNS